METPATTRDIQAETERRMTGGPDPVAAFDLLSADKREEIEADPHAAIEALWSSWLDQTVKLHGLGFTPHTLAGAVNTVAEVRAERIESGAHETA